MKKSLLALAIAAVFTVTACDDKTASKLLEAEKKIAQLEANNEKLSTELAQLKAVFPTLQVEIVDLFRREEKIKLPQQDGNTVDEAELSLVISTAKTNVAWIDNLLLKEIYDIHLLTEDKAKREAELAQVTEEKAKTFFQTFSQELEEEVKAYQAGNYTLSTETVYIGQREKVVSFVLEHYNYMGGAHGLGYSRYVNIDTDKKAVIQLDDLISPESQQELKDILWRKYQFRSYDETDEMKKPEFMQKADFYITREFYFTPYGISFVYPVYALGPYVEGEIELFASFAELVNLLDKKYLPKK